MSSEYIQEKKKFQADIIEYIDSEENAEEHYQNLTQYFQDQNIKDSKPELEVLFNIITRIANFHYRSSDFFSKIEKLILIFKDDLSQKFSNMEIYNIFGSNKRILLFLLQENILTLNLSICEKISIDKDSYYYFYPEITSLFPQFKPKDTNKSDRYREYLHSFLENTENDKKEIIELIETNRQEFERKRKVAENDSYICQLIREDDIENFIIFINQNNHPLDSKIKHSIFETNSFLIRKKDTTMMNRFYLSLMNCSESLIEYAAFFGSIQIFKYLYMNKVDLNGILWFYAIHGCHPEIIRILEENKIQPNKKLNKRQTDSAPFNRCFLYSMKCFNTETTDYIQKTYITDFDYSIKAIKYFNFQYFPEKLNNEEIFGNLCKYGYFTLVNFLIETSSIDLNKPFENMPLIFTAILYDHFEIVKLLFESGSFDINNRIEYKAQNGTIKIIGMLHIAVKNENIKMIQYLLSIKDVNANLHYLKTKKTSYGGYSTDYILEIENTNESEEMKFFEYDELGNIILYKKTALHLAAKIGNKSIVSLLLNNSTIDVNAKTLVKKYKQRSSNSHGVYENISSKERFIESPLSIALKSNNFEVAQLLLNHPNIDMNSNSIYNCEYLYDYNNYKKYKERQCSGSAGEYKTILYLAIEKENVETVQLLLRNPNIDVNAQSTILVNQEELVEFVHEIFNMDSKEAENNAVDPVTIKQTSLELAISKQNPEILKLLLQQPSIDVINNSCGINAFKKSIGNGHVEIFNLLINRPDLNVISEFKGALHKAVSSGNIEMVKVILDRPLIDVNEIVDGKTALEIAAKVGNVEIFRLLLNRPDIDIMKNNCAQSAFKEAALKGNIEIFKILFDRPEININDNENGVTALKNAVSGGNVEIVKLLLNKPDINVNDSTGGKNAMKIAAEMKNIEMVKLLLTRPEIKFDPETIYNDVDYDKFKIIYLLLNSKQIGENPYNSL